MRWGSPQYYGQRDALVLNTYYFVCETQTWQWRNVAKDHPSKTITRFFLYLEQFIVTSEMKQFYICHHSFLHESWVVVFFCIYFLEAGAGIFFSHKHFIYSRLPRDFLNSFLMPVLHAIKPLSHILGDFIKSSFKSTHSMNFY